MTSGSWSNSSADRFEIDGERVRISIFEDAMTVGDTLSYEISPSGTANTYTLTSR